MALPHDGSHAERRRGNSARRQPGVWLLLALCTASMLASCSLPPRLAAVLFEGVPPPGKEAPPQPVVRHPRRQAYKPPEVHKAKRPEVVVRPSLADWEERFRELPRRKDGGVDWDQALDQQMITPKPGLDPKAQPQMVFDYNVELVPAGLPAFKVVFPHKPHTEWLGCTNCHTEIFQMKKGADQITMEKIFAGEFCGRCHGKVSFELTSCARCHVAMPQ